ncbi:hypothetical protein [Nannocystis radixulma]|uniref:Peptidase M16 N-terminal domain-containing protein n=1 Tax=Nannocystis radixulma TaxID=2995305 RepID=A0ABT5B4K0_9BACT|nr:hypothetical protein [Nannocystis radixulma]MDC0668605.1 hypothetical protein [Nannocystis radixulma]
MLAPRRFRALGAALVLLGQVVGGSEVHAAPASPAAPPTAPPTEPVPADSPAPSADTVLDLVLPCGLRVLAAQDLSLPVAAVVLAVETGSEDDPPEHPGLVHALAYHLHQGNRELRPGEAIAAAQDAGGVHLLSTGPGQVRFESLVPITRLDEVLFAESQRLRFPTVDTRRWDISLGWAAADVRSPPGLRPRDLAALHGAPGLGHDGRAVDRSLAEIAPAALAAALASKFNYARATLIVVAPEPAATILDQVRNHFRDLPPAARALPSRPPPPPRAPVQPAATGTAAPGGASALAPPAATGNRLGLVPRAPAESAGAAATTGNLLGFIPSSHSAATSNFLGFSQASPAPALLALAPAEAGKPAATPAATPAAGPTTLPAPAPAPAAPPAASGKPPLFAWPVPPTAAASAWAGAICRALNRQKPTADESRKSRIGCDFDPDPRRAALVLRPIGADDPVAFVRARLARLGGPDQGLLASQAQFMAQAIRLYGRTPLGLARLLAASPAQLPGPVPPDSPVARRRDELLGLASLGGRPVLTLTVEEALLIGPAELKP